MEVSYSSIARGQLAELEKNDRARIFKKIRFFASQPDPLVFAKHLAGYAVYRFRVGDYRIVFDVVDTTLIHVMVIRKRDGIYKGLS